MKNLIVILTVFLSFGEFALAQDVRYNFNHCRDDSFKVVSLDETTGSIEIQIKLMNELNPDSLGVYENARFTWFFRPDTISIVGESRLYQKDGVSMSWQEGEGKTVQADADVHFENFKLNLEGNILTFSSSLTQKELSILSSIDGLPDQKTPGFYAGNLHLE